MTEPIKISDLNRPLSCDEFDQNMDILRDRSNHTGTQSCNTLNDLDTCLATSTTVSTINATLNSTSTRVTNIENSLSSSGSIQNDLNSLESSLTADINQNRASITALETEVDALNIRVLGAESNLTSLTAVVNSNNTDLENDIAAVIGVNNNQNSRLTIVEGRATTLNSNILTEAAARQSADSNLQANIDAEITSRIAADNNLQTLIDNEETARITANNTLQTNLTSVNTTLDNKITVEKNARITADSNLQVQINNLTNSLSGAIPSATLLPYLGNFNTVPTGFLLCAGAAVSRSTYATLFSLIGTRYGAGNGTTTFNLPDLRDKIIYGSFAGNLDSVAPILGSNTKSIGITNMPNHDHLVTQYNHTHTVNTVHEHGLNIRSHTHSNGFIGAHGHSLNPFRTYPEGGGDEDDSGAELTSVPVEDGTNTGFPNTAINNAPGAPINPADVKIYPTGQNPNINKTDPSGGTLTTSNNSNGGTVYYTATKGDGNPLDVRQASIQLNYIIKT